MTSVETLNPQAAGAVESIREFVSQIAVIDAELGDTGDSIQEKKARVVREYLASDENASKLVNLTVEKLGANLSNFGDNTDAQISVVAGVLAELQKKYRKPMKANLDTRIDSTNSPKANPVSPERQTELMNERNRIYALTNLYVDMLPHYGVSVDKVDGKPDLSDFDIDFPKNKRIVGPRGADFDGQYDFFVDGVKLPRMNAGKADEKPLTIANLLQVSQLNINKLLPDWNTKTLKDYILNETGLSAAVTGRKADGSGGTLPAQTSGWEVKMPTPINKTLKAVFIGEGKDESEPAETPETEQEDAF